MKARSILIFSLVVGLALLLTAGPGRVMAVAAQPRVVVAVAPTSALDPAGAKAPPQRTDGNLNPGLAPSAPCDVSGLITTDTTWGPGLCDPYVVTGNVSVEPGVTLTIQAGTTMRFNSLKALGVRGTLVACGAETDPIVFTSNQPSPAAGDWAYVQFADSSADASPDRDCSGHGRGSIVRYAIIEYAGGMGGYNNGALLTEASSPLIVHNIIRNSGNDGISVKNNGAPRITNNTITDNADDGIDVQNSQYGVVSISDNMISDNSGGGIYADSDVAISGNAITDNRGGGGIYVSPDNTATISGNTITGNTSSSGGGGVGVHLYSGRTAAITCNTISGNSAPRGGGIYVETGTPTIITNTITNNTATQVNGGGGIYLRYDNACPTISDNNLHGNMTGNPANTPNDLYNGNRYNTGCSVHAENNYWGTTDPSVIEDHIWHNQDDPSLSYVYFVPPRDSSVPPCTPTSVLTPTLYAISNPDGDGNYTVDWSDVTGALTYTLHEDDNAGFTSPITRYTGGTSRVAVNGQPVGTWYYRVKATNASGESGWSSVQSITVNPSSPVARVTVSGPTTGTAGAPYTFAASASPLTATQPITYAWQASGQSPVTYVDGLSVTFSMTWSATGSQVITVTASNACGSARASHTITISEPGDAYEPDDACIQASALTTVGSPQTHTFHQQADQDWAHFAVTSGITYVVQAISTGPGADLVLELYDACGGNLAGSDDYALGANAHVIFTASSSGTYYVKALNHISATYGFGVTYDLSVRVRSQVGLAIIVAGRKYNPERLQANINYVANQAFRVFQDGGIPAEDIYYLHHDTTQDADGDGHPDVDTTATTPTLQYAITTWAVSRARPGTPVYLYMVDHGTDNLFLVDGYGDAVTPGQLNGWLNTLEDTTGCLVNVMIESCRSGSFIGTPEAISKPGRVIVTAAASGQSAHAYVDGQGAYFSNHFLSLLGDNADLWTSYSQTRDFLESARLGQTPWLDDNGDAISDGQDGAIARQRGLLSPIWETVPWIASVSAPAQITGYTAVITATVYEDKPLPLVWAEVIAPSYRVPDDGDEMVTIDVPRPLLSDGNGDGTYEGTYGGFTEIGEYRVVVYARDVDGNQGVPKSTTVRRGWLVYLPVVLR